MDGLGHHTVFAQASAYKSGEVVETLKKAFLPDDGSNTMTFNTEDEVLQYLGNKVRAQRARWA